MIYSGVGSSFTMANPLHSALVLQTKHWCSEFSGPGRQRWEDDHPLSFGAYYDRAATRTKATNIVDLMTHGQVALTEYIGKVPSAKMPTIEQSRDAVKMLCSEFGESCILPIKELKKPTKATKEKNEQGFEIVRCSVNQVASHVCKRVGIILYHLRRCLDEEKLNACFASIEEGVNAEKLKEDVKALLGAIEAQDPPAKKAKVQGGGVQPDGGKADGSDPEDDDESSAEAPEDSDSSDEDESPLARRAPKAKAAGKPGAKEVKGAPKAKAAGKPAAAEATVKPAAEATHERHAEAATKNEVSAKAKAAFDEASGDGKACEEAAGAQTKPSAEAAEV